MSETRMQRGDILRIIEQHPGCHLRGLERRMPLPFGTLRHHLRKLEDAGLIHVEYDKRYKRYFPTAMTAEVRDTCAALQQRQMRRIMVLLLTGPPATPKAMASSLGLARSTLGEYLHRLAEKGIVARAASAEGTWSLRNPATVKSALSTYRSSFIDRVVDGALEVFEGADAAAPELEHADRAEE